MKEKKKLAIFDIDETLIEGDSDYLWGVYLVEKGYLKKEEYFAKNKHFHDNYSQGKLDMYDYVEFSFQPFTTIPKATLLQLRQDYFKTKIRPLYRPKAIQVYNAHKQQGYTMMLITATNDFITAALAEDLAADVHIATRVEERAGKFTGKTVGIPSFRDGKVLRLQEWLDKNPDHSLAGSYFYSDSMNDVFLLEQVDHPRVVAGDTKLLAYAKQKGWTILSFSKESS